MSANKKGLKDAVMSHNIPGVGLTDEPAVVDSLGCDKYCEGLAEFVTNCPTPMTIAIQGGWGTGKSTIMKIVQDKIKDKTITLEFNTWKYARSAGKMLTLPLLLDFVSRLDEAGEKDNAYKQKYMSKDVAKKVKKALSGILGTVIYAGEGAIAFLQVQMV